jgi:hypothetical protein
VTFSRAIFAFVFFALIADYKFGNGHLTQSVSAQTAELGYKLSYRLSAIARRISP